MSKLLFSLQKVDGSTDESMAQIMCGSPWPDEGIPVGASFDPTKELFASSFFLTTSDDRFHLLLWQKLFPDTTDFVLMTPTNLVAPRLVFNTAKSRDEFETWLSEYRARFPGGEASSHAMPSIPRGVRVNGVAMEWPAWRNKQSSENYERLLELWAWVLQTCRKPVWFEQTVIVFEDDTDAVEYKMRFL